MRLINNHRIGYAGCCAHNHPSHVLQISHTTSHRELLSNVHTTSERTCTRVAVGVGYTMAEIDKESG